MSERTEPKARICGRSRDSRRPANAARDFYQEFPAERLTLYREPTSLVVREAKLPPAKPSFENSVLLEQVDDSGLLLALDPTTMATTNNVKGWRSGVLMTEDSSFPWRTKR